jgi:hypothetical protein
MIGQTYISYAGIGSRTSPEDVLHQMREFSFQAANLGWTLRSGGADAADKTFEVGCDDANGKKEIFLPWRGFNHNVSPLYTPSADSFRIGAEIHPAWQYLKEPQRKLIARNMHQILGKHLAVAVKLVVCYTPDGCESYKTYSQKTGGTGTAISLASLNNIPIFNLKNEGRAEQALEFITQHSQNL